MTRLLCLCSALILALPSPAQQTTSPFAGTWEISVELMGAPAPETCSMHAEGKSLKGVCKMASGQSDIVGEIEGNDISFRHSADVMGNPVAFSFKGKVADDQNFSGTMGIDEFGMTTDFKAKKTGPETGSEKKS